MTDIATEREPIPDTTTLEPPVPVWTLPNGDTIPQVLTLAPIPDGRTHPVRVTFRNPRELRAGDRDDVLAAMPEAKNRASAAGNLLAAIAATLIDSWEFTDLPLPRVAPTSLRQLEIADYDAITDAIAPALELLFPMPAVTGATPNRPTEPSSS